jgi:hypothetical protein
MGSTLVFNLDQSSVTELSAALQFSAVDNRHAGDQYYE